MQAVESGVPPGRVALSALNCTQCTQCSPVQNSAVKNIRVQFSSQSCMRVADAGGIRILGVEECGKQRALQSRLLDSTIATLVALHSHRLLGGQTFELIRLQACELV